MSSLFGAPKPPPIAAPAPMPDPQSPAVIDAQQRSAAAAMSRAGRQSTILGNPNAGGGSAAPRTGTDTYAGNKLGSQ